MKVILSPRAEKQLKKLPKISQIIIAKKIRSLRDDPTHKGVETLKGYINIFRIRIGDFRIVYRMIKGEVYIVLIGHRKDIYEKLKKLFN